VPLVIAVTGRVFSRKPIKCELSKEDAVITQFQEEKRSDQRVGSIWSTFREPVRFIMRETDWSIRDNSGVELPIIKGSQANISSFYLSGETYTPPPDTNLAQRALDEIRGRRELGVWTKETYLPMNVVVTIVGELRLGINHPGDFSRAVRSSQDGGKMLVLTAPSRGSGMFAITSLSLPEFIANVEGISRECGVWGGWITAAGVCCLAVSVWDRWSEWWTVRKMRRQFREEGGRRIRGEGVQGGGGGEGEGGEAQGRRTCVVCWTNECNTVFPQCGHMCVCIGCSGGLDRCPMCRVAGHAIRVFET
jgi:E3 ubiquitin-protein ligase MUL1